MKVKYIHEKPGVHTGNIMWPKAWPMRAGRFPADHPVGGTFGGRGDDQFGESEAMEVFRSRGYWASCFPEGDGITMRCLKGQTARKVVLDIAECFGWQVAKAQ